MAPKRGPVEKVEAKQVLTAVLLADSFTQRFRPITVEQPKVLLPLVNAPLLEYTLEWLASNAVEEIIIFCCAHADQIQEHLKAGKWLKQRAPRVITVTSTACFSLGEAMRSLDQRDIIKGTFILVTGDTVSNADLRPILAAHRERAERDKDAIMTLVMKSVQTPYQRLRLGDSNLVVALDKNTQRLLKYQELESHGTAADSSSGAAAAAAAAAAAGGDAAHAHHHHHHHHHHHGRRRGAQLWKLDAALWSERDVVQVRTDLLDTNISICSPEVLLMFSDNFDYQTLKRDFVVGTLSEEELGKKIYAHVLQGEYAARVHNLRSYDAISRDLLSRWAYPFVPDTNVFFKDGPWGPSSYRYGRGLKYLESQTTCSRKARLGPCIAIGAGTTIGDDCIISRCVIGRGCTIGKGVALHGCYLQDHVVVEDNVTATASLLCGGVTVHAGAVLQPGVVLSHNVVVGARHTVPGLSTITLCKQLQGQVSLSDDELEYSSAGRASGSGGGRVSMDGKPAAGGKARRGSKAGPTGSDSGSSSSSSSDEDSDGDDTSSSSSFGTTDGGSLEKPSAQVLKVAKVLSGSDKKAIAHVAAEAAGLGFATHLVGEGGAGYEWPQQADSGFDASYFSIAPPPMRVLTHHGYDSDAEGDDGAATGGGSGDEAGSGAAAGAAGGSGRSGDAGGARLTQAQMDPETVFMQEVAETFLRCVKERFAEDNVVIELNALKIAEDRSFADCARYILTTLLALCLPAPAWVSPEYACLFAGDAPDTGAKDGKLALLSRFKKQMTKWHALLHRFLTSEDDQVELLLTMEEFCGEEGVFELPPHLQAKQVASASNSSSGAAFAPLFANLLQLLYDVDLVDEAAINAWAQEKQHADEDEKVFLHKCSAFLEWLKTADEDSSEEESDD